MYTNIVTGTNTQLEKKFIEYKTLESDRVDIRNFFCIADYKRKADMVQNIDIILSNFNKIHEESTRQQIDVIDKGVEDILANLSTFRNEEKVIDVLAELN